MSGIAAVRAPEAIAARLREPGAAFDLSQVQSLHAPLAAAPRPMEMCVHGGGFVRGDEAKRLAAFREKVKDVPMTFQNGILADIYKKIQAVQ